MKKKTLFFSIFLLISLCPIRETVQSIWAIESSKPSFDILIKIHRLDQTLTLIDTLFGPARPESSDSPVSKLKGLIHGTDWIDFSRLIVIGIDTSEPGPTGGILVPFIKPNESFRQAYQASLGSGFYYIAFPLGQGKSTDSMKKVLGTLSTSKSKSTLSMEVSFSRILKKSDPKIRQFLSQMEDLPVSKRDGRPPFASAELRDLFSGILDQGLQIETLSFDFDLNQKEIRYEISAKAHDQSQLWDLLKKEDKEAFLNAYKPKFQMNFKSRSFNIEKTFSFFGETFGKFYKAMGIDFHQLAKIGKDLSGEMAGGASFDQKGMVFEIIYVLNAEASGKNFIESVYLPWLMEFGQSITSAMEKEIGEKITPLFIRGKESTVEGFKVIGVKTKIPNFFESKESPVPPAIKAMLEYEFRMTVVNNLFLTASNDQRLAALIHSAKGFKKEVSKHPLMTLNYDLEPYLQTIKQITPESLLENRPIPRLGKIHIRMDADRGIGRFTASTKTEDIRSLIAFFKDLPGSGLVKKDNAGSLPEVSDQEMEVFRLLEKGILASMQGDHPLAVSHFETVIRKYPQNSDAHFYRGIAFQEMGNLSEALTSLNRAISLNPEKGDYYYGRGRVYLLFKEPETAMRDFKQAAALGNEDARIYLKSSPKFK
jgi:tetratricopeptide (TPR) repeat protein